MYWWHDDACPWLNSSITSPPWRTTYKIKHHITLRWCIGGRRSSTCLWAPSCGEQTSFKPKLVLCRPPGGHSITCITWWWPFESLIQRPRAKPTWKLISQIRDIDSTGGHNEGFFVLKFSFLIIIIIIIIIRYFVVPLFSFHYDYLTYCNTTDRLYMSITKFTFRPSFVWLFKGKYHDGIWTWLGRRPCFVPQLQLKASKERNIHPLFRFVPLHLSLLLL